MFNMDGASKFHFDWKDLVKSGLSVKDAIAPTAFAFKNSRTFQMGGIFCAASFLSITASDISDQLLKDFLDMDSSQIVTMHIQSVDQNRAIKTVKRTITELDRSKIEEQKKAIRAGYDIDIIPSDLATYGRDAKALLKELQSQNERMFLVTFLVLNTGRTEQELENNVFQASSIAQKHNCNLCRLDFQQEQGLMSSLPLADCQIEIQRGLTTSSTAIFVPFTTQELFDNGTKRLEIPQRGHLLCRHGPAHRLRAGRHPPCGGSAKRCGKSLCAYPYRGNSDFPHREKEIPAHTRSDSPQYSLREAVCGSVGTNLHDRQKPHTAFPGAAYAG